MALQPFLSNRPASEATFAANSDGTPHAARSGGFQQLFDRPAQPESGTAGQSRLDAAQVEVIEENGRIASIVVTCKCCERIELACRY